MLKRRRAEINAIESGLIIYSYEISIIGKGDRYALVFLNYLPRAGYQMG